MTLDLFIFSIFFLSKPTFSYLNQSNLEVLSSSHTWNVKPSHAEVFLMPTFICI